MKKSNLIIIALLCASAYSKEPELEELIKSTNENSLAQKAANEDLEVAGVVKERSSRHWLPKVYLTGQSFFSNDPGTALFGKLSQREIQSSDFLSVSLNHPESTLYSKAVIGVNLPLYEGGEKTSINKAMIFLSDSKVSQAKAVRNEIYVEIVKNYLVGKNLTLEKSDLSKIKSTIDSIINRYQVGNKSNQLGYSGLLGLKSLKNKITALLAENTAKLSATEKGLAELSGANINYKYSNDTTVESLIEEYLSYSENQYTPSDKVKSFFQNAQSSNEIIGAEKSRNLPRFGLFGESFAFRGNRATGTGYTTGIYLNWNLFSSSDYGASTEAIHKSKAAQYLAEATQQKEKVEYEGFKDSLGAINHSLLLLNESENYLEEQTKISHTLFKNGLINALQYVEVLSRRIDLIKSISSTKSELIAIHSQLAKNSSDTMSQGATL
jgi:outer membrane protein TolC